MLPIPAAELLGTPPAAHVAYPMLIKLLVFLCNASPLLRRLLWRWWYSKLARQVGTAQWTFMNYGYAPDSGAPLPLQTADEPDRLCIQLYEHVTQPANLAGADVLEVGSGRGGGASYVARYRSPASVTGADFSPQAVAFCAQRHQTVPNLHFQTGDAENLPFPDASFDAVINVESSHCYGNVRRFFSEACRVLRPGGWFLYADFRPVHEMPELEAMLRDQPWQFVEKEDITAGVLRALEQDDARKRSLIAEYVPPKLHNIFSEFAGVEGGKIHQAFRAGDLLYLRFAFRKT